MSYDSDPMTDADRALLLYRAGIRANLRADAARAAEAARHLVASARDARLPVPRDVERAVNTLSWVQWFIGEQLDREQVERDRLGLDAATYQRRVERHPPRPS